MFCKYARKLPEKQMTVYKKILKRLDIGGGFHYSPNSIPCQPGRFLGVSGNRCSVLPLKLCRS